MKATERLNIGILALQGDFAEHLRAIKQAGAEGILVKKTEQMSDINGLIIPGGESTTIAILTDKNDTLFDTIKDRVISGMPVYGTCMGTIFLAKEIEGSNQGRLGLMSIKVRRNGFGPQRASFQSDVDIVDSEIGDKPFPAVFIRAPIILSHSSTVKVLGTLEDNNVVLAREKNMLVSTFHPELTNDSRIHRYFLQMVEDHLLERQP